MPIRARLAALAAAALLAVPGCALFNAVDVSVARHTTIGRELMDLQEAKDKGLLTEAEYAKARADILAGRPFPSDED